MSNDEAIKALNFVKMAADLLNENESLRAELISLKLSIGDYQGSDCCETCGDGPLEVGHVHGGYHLCEPCFIAELVQ